MSKRLNKSDSIHEQLNFLGYMGMGTGGIPTTDNIPETTEKLGCPTDNIPKTTERLGCPTDNIPDNRFF